MNNQTHLHRRRAIESMLTAATLSVLGFGSRVGSRGVMAQSPLSTLYIADDVDRAVQRGVEYLADLQRNTGAIFDRSHDVTMTSLAVMAFASLGIQPGETSELGSVMQRAIDFVLSPRNQDETGYFGNSDGSRMYGHGIITLMLTEVLGMGADIDQNRRIHDALVPAIELILAAQKISKPPTHQGGWRYTPTSRDSDLSASVWQLMALRSAKNDGLDVPGQAIEMAIKYLRESYVMRGSRDGEIPEVSGFSYAPGAYQPTFTMTSAGLLAMQVCGLYDSPMVSGAAKWLLEHPPKINERYFYYGIYYYAQGMHQAGGKFAETADAIVADLLLDAQNTNGSWIAGSGEERNVGAVYASSLAILSLSVRYHYLPIYQR